MILSQAEVNDPALRPVELNLKQALEVREININHLIDLLFYPSCYHNGGSDSVRPRSGDTESIDYTLTQIRICLEVQVELSRSFPELAERE